MELLSPWAYLSMCVNSCCRMCFESFYTLYSWEAIFAWKPLVSRINMVANAFSLPCKTLPTLCNATGGIGSQECIRPRQWDPWLQHSAAALILWR